GNTKLTTQIVKGFAPKRYTNSIPRLPLSEENAWLHTGRSLFRASHRNITIIGFPLNVSLQKKCPTLFSNEPTTGGSRTPVLLATQYKLHNRVFGLKRRSVSPSKRLPSWPGISVVE